MEDLYLDANAHQPLSAGALAVYHQFITSRAGSGNPASPSIPGVEAASALKKARQQIAELLKVDSRNIIFTNTCTQAAQWALDIFENIEPTEDRYVSPIEHPAVREPTKKWKKLKVDYNGVVEYIKATKIACIHMQNEIGTIQPINELKSKYLFSDMCQSLGKTPVYLNEVDVAIFGAHKFGGPANVGFFYLKNMDWWRPYGTGSRYGSDRAGTMDVASVVATATALQEALETISERSERALRFRNVLEPALKEMGFRIIGEGAVRCPNTTFVLVPQKSSHLLLHRLGQAGIHVGLGSACGSMHTGGSPTMHALGINAGADELMRFSQFGWYGETEAEQVVDVISKIF